MEELGEVVDTDVLIVGGGIGGLAAAVKAKEEHPELDVLIVEKQTTGWAGKATKIGGVLTFLGPDDDADSFIDFQVRTAGCYLNDQQALSKYVRSTARAMEELAQMGRQAGPDSRRQAGHHPGLLGSRLLRSPSSTST